VSSIGVGNQSSINKLNDFKLKFASAAKTNGWCVFLIHGIDNDGGYSPVTSAELTKSIEYLSVRKSKFWVTTFLNATLYSKERNAVNVTETSANDSSMTLKVTDTLTDSIYHFPLTIRRSMPANWPSANVTQDGIEVPMRIVLEGSVVYLTFDVIPDAGEVKLTKNLKPVTPEADTIPADDEDQVSIQYPNKDGSDIGAVCNNGRLHISITGISSRNLTICLYDVRGITVYSQKIDYMGENEIFVDFNKNALKSGMYLVGVFDGKNSWNKKIIIS
jgi:hypothetical protein